MGESTMNLYLETLPRVLFTLLLSIQLSWASEYVPWQNDDYAIFKSETTQKTLRIDKTSSVWRHLTDFAGFGPSWLYSGNNSDVVMLYSPNTISFQTFIDFSQPIDSTNDISILPCNTGQVRIAEKSSNLRTSAGLFQDVIRLELSSNCSDAGITNIWFAKHVGIIQWTELNISGELTYQMRQAKIGGKIYPTTEGIIVSAQFPEPVVWINQIPPLPNETPRVSVGLTIENKTTAEVTYHFGSSQRYDIIIRNQQGELTRWSRGFNFAAVLGEVTIPSNGQYHVADSLELLDSEGSVLSPGIYELEILLTAEREIKSSQTINIKHAH